MLKNKVGKIMLVLLAALLPAAAFAELVLKPADCVIVVTGKENQFKRAAEELAFHLKEITGQTVPVVKQAPEGKYVINIGKKPSDAPEKYTATEEGYWKFGPREAWFYGNPSVNWYYGNCAGPVLYAVYDFLENELGVRWPYPGIVCAPKQNPLKIGRQEGKYVHSVYKHFLWPRSIREWVERMRSFTDLRTGAGHAFTDWWKKYGKTHPEYFALSQGRRAPIRLGSEKADDITRTESRMERIISMCVSNPAVADQVVRNWNGKTAILNICENDSAAPFACHCASCRALDADPKGKLDNFMGADRYVDFGNRVLKAARKIRKDVKVIYFAYNASEQPPRKTRIEPGTIISIVPTDFRWEQLTGYINAWKKAGMTEFIYRPNWHHYFAPMGFPIGYDRFAFRIQQFIYRSGGCWSYDTTRTIDPFRIRNDYILCHAMLEPERPFEYWEKHYAEAFGPAQQDVIDYFRFWTRIWNERIEKKILDLMARKSYETNLARVFLPQISRYYRTDDFIRSGKILNRALSRKLEPQARKYLLHLKQFHDHAALMLKCVNTKSMNDIRKLVDFRNKNAIGTRAELERRFDNPLGIRTTPGINTPVLWHFRLDPKDEGVRDHWFAQTDFSGWDGMMPTNSPWENPAVVKGHPSAELRKKTASYDGVAWYAQKIKIPPQWKTSRILLHFGAVDESAEVWVNGKKAGEHPFIKPDDWKTPFDIDITKLVDWTKPEQTVTVRVTDKTGAGGIWKPVEVRFVDNWVPRKDALFQYFDFEQHSDGMCLGWTNAFGCTEKPQAGKGCMRQKSNGGNWDVSRSGSYFPVKPGEKYKLSVWNRNSLTAGEAQFMIRFITKDKKNTLKNGYLIRKVVPGTQQWEQYEQEFVVPADCGYIQIFFRVVNPIGNVYWDSVELFRAEPVK